MSMKKISNVYVKKWYDISHNNIKIKKPIQEQIKTGIKKNSRIFFSTLRKIKEEDIVTETLDKAETIATPTK